MSFGGRVMFFLVRRSVNGTPGPGVVPRFAEACRQSFHSSSQSNVNASRHGLATPGFTACFVSPRSSWAKCRLHTVRNQMYRTYSGRASTITNVSSEAQEDSRRMNADKSPLLFRQLLDYKSYTYTYLLADPSSRMAVLIDPVLEMVERDVAVVRDLGLDLLFAVNTHVHADHVTGTGEIKKRLPMCQSVISKVSEAKADMHVSNGDNIKFGSYQLECYNTPGHTNGCMSYVLKSEGMVFTGDAVLIRGCGRTDFQEGDAGRLYDSVHSKILSLPRHFKIFPAHDYTGQTSSTVGEELQHNRRLTRTRDEFIKIMDSLNLPYPKQIDKALPANMVCGVFDEVKGS